MTRRLALFVLCGPVRLNGFFDRGPCHRYFGLRFFPAAEEHELGRFPLAPAPVNSRREGGVGASKLDMSQTN